MTLPSKRTLLIPTAAVATIMVAIAVTTHKIIKRSREHFYTQSCANHLTQIKSALNQLACEKQNAILPETDDTRKALSIIEPYISKEWIYHPSSACPESYIKNHSIGYIYIGDGLRLNDVVEKNWIILFCPAGSHRGSSEHCHAWNANSSCVESNEKMIALLKKALSQAKSGEIPYSKRAINVLEHEIAARQSPASEP